MDFHLSDEDRQLRETVRQFVEEIVNPVWQEIDKTDRIPATVLDRARELGLFGLSIAPEYGGLGLSIVQKALVHEMLGRGPWGLASYISVHTGIGCTGINLFGSPEQKAKYLPKMASGEWLGSFGLTEPDAGSDAGNLQTRAERKGDAWVLNGRKVFITNAPYAHHVLVFARTDVGITAFLVDTDTPGYQVGQVFDTLGHQGSAICELVLEDCRIPADAIVGEEGRGFDIAKRSLSEGRTMLGSRSVGAAQKAMELAIEHGEQRRTFGKALLDHQALSFRVAQMSARTDAARGLCYRSAWMLDRGEQAIRESSTAKLFAADGLWQTVDDAVQMLGGYGYIRGEYMLERIWRDARVVRVYDGSSEVQQIVIAQRLRKGDVESRW
ncbi:MAG: acyl-CoA dehydrogenase [Deltaproteobacteria bacterium]|nr:acyl-CoA dehydrogenase [Deltaproteobacteria bacterium]